MNTVFTLFQQIYSLICRSWDGERKTVRDEKKVIAAVTLINGGSTRRLYKEIHGKERFSIMYDPYDYDKDYESKRDNEEKTDRAFNENGYVNNEAGVKKAEMKSSKEIKRAERKKAGKGSAHKWGTAIACGLLFGVFAAAAFQAVSFAGGRLTERFVPAQVSEVGESVALSSGTSAIKEVGKVNGGVMKTATEWDGKPVTVIYDVTEVAENVMPSIVSITNKSVQEVRSMYYGSMKYESESAGSGIILGENDTELLIMTNNHVVEGSKELTVGFIDDEVYPAVIKGTDQADDLAVIAVKKEDIKKETLDKIAIADIGDSETLKIGQPVVAIGNALGYGQSVTAGIVSALDREVSIDNMSNDLIQTDAAINPGNSGGALLNLQGQVIGINSAKYAAAEVEGMGYAIPISDAMPILEELMNRASRDKVEEDERGYLGIANNIDLPQDYADALGIPKGVYITEVIKDSPAEKAGLLKGDVLKKFDGIAVTDMSNLKEQMQYYKAGETVELLILRSDSGEYKEKTVKVTLGTRDVLGEDADTGDEDNEDEETEEKSGDQKEIEDYIEEDRENGNQGQYRFNFDPFSIFGF
ncbi:MAG TPA: hypothetical protein DCL38_01615 [Lachnospiraceae bacterium]|nr:hypothetical protein [Lachnospiraceae bacterium]